MRSQVDVDAAAMPAAGHTVSGPVASARQSARVAFRQLWLQWQDCDRRFHLVFACVLAVWLGAAYRPSLGHFHRADQWCFLVDTTHCHSFSETVSRFYSYNRTRINARGDAALFRPVLFTLLAAERAAFGADATMWQAASLVMHGLVCYLAVLVMTPARPDSTERDASGFWGANSKRLAAYCVALFFALNASIQEQVIWTHIGGYLLFVILTLSSLLCLRHYLGNQAKGVAAARLSLCAGWLLALVAAFTYELGQAYAILVGLYLALSKTNADGPVRKLSRLAVLGAFGSICLIYQAANFGDALIHNDGLPPLADSIVQSIFREETLENLGHYLKFTIIQPFFPGQSIAFAHPAGRLQIEELQKFPLELVTILGSAVLVCLTGYAIAALIRLRRNLASTGFSVVCMGLAGGHAALIVLGRLNLRGSDVLISNTYYAYLPLLFVLLGVMSLWRASPRPIMGWPAKLVFGTLIAGLLTVSAHSTAGVWAANVAYERIMAYERNGIDLLAEWVAGHRNEAGFSFAVDMDHSAFFPPTHYGVSNPQIFFDRYIDVASPKYIVTFDGGQISAIRTADIPSEAGAPRPQIAPALVRLGDRFNTYQYEGRYYGVFHWDNYYTPAKNNFHYLIEGRTLDEIGVNGAEMTARLDADIRAGRFTIPNQAAVEVLATGYQGYNILRFHDNVIGFPECESPFDGLLIRKPDSPRQFVGQTIDDVRAQIAAHKQTTQASPVALDEPGTSVPWLVLQNYHGFNVIQCGGKFYGIPQDGGAFDEVRARRGSYQRLAQGRDIESVKRQIEALTQASLEQKEIH